MLPSHLSLVLFATLIAQAPSAPTSGPVEITSVAVVDEMQDIQGRTWRPAAPDTSHAVVIRTRIARGGEYATKDFELRLGAGASATRVPCAGVTARIPDGWAINEKGVEWSFYPGGTGTLDGLGLLFVVPKGASKGTLLFKGKAAGEPFEIK